MKTTEKLSEIKTRLIVGLRWIAVLPAAILAMFLARFICNIPFVYMGLDTFFDGFYGLFVRAMHIAYLAVIGAVAFTFFGAKAAPSHRKIVIHVLGGIGLTVYGAGLFESLMKPDYWDAIESVASAVGFGFVMYNADEILKGSSSRKK